MPRSACLLLVLAGLIVLVTIGMLAYFFHQQLSPHIGPF
jgi:hypothetical protein